MKIAQPWPDPTFASIVVGGGWPGMLNAAVVPNFLFICDGFTNADSNNFVQLVNSIVRHFKTNHHASPFDVLATSINFWRVFLPSDARGISILCEVYTTTQDGECAA